jgi:hypothetical protein
MSQITQVLTLNLIGFHFFRGAMYVQCPPEHIKSALNSYGDVKFVEKIKNFPQAEIGKRADNSNRRERMSCSVQ